MRYSSIFITGLALALGTFACSSDSAMGVSVDDPAESEDAISQGGYLRVYESQNGKTLAVVEGRPVYVYLDVEPGTGRVWEVTKTDRTLGYPTSTTSVSGPFGPGTRTRFKWATSGPFSMLGKHELTLEYRGPNDTKAQKTFSFTLDVQSGHAAADAGTPDGATTTRTPICANVGTRSEGWAWSDGSGFIGWDNCKFATAECRYTGSSKEGFYRADNGKAIALGACETSASTCPALTPPAPGYCSNGVTSVTTDSKGCSQYKCTVQ